MSKDKLPRTPALGVLIALLALSACGLDKVNIPPLIGPAELGVSLQMFAKPDILAADGVSVSAIVVTVRDPDGRPLPGLPIFFQLFGDGELLGAGGVVVGDGLQMVPDSQGVINLFYRAGTRSGTVVVTARPYGWDANAAVVRTVAIEVR